MQTCARLWHVDVVPGNKVLTTIKEHYPQPLSLPLSLTLSLYLSLSVSLSNSVCGSLGVSFSLTQT